MCNKHNYKHEPSCIGCGKKASELTDVQYMAKVNQMTPTAYVQQEEGTYDMFIPNKFFCDACYITNGMPNHNGIRQWTKEDLVLEYCPDCDDDTLQFFYTVFKEEVGAVRHAICVVCGREDADE